MIRSTHIAVALGALVAVGLGHFVNFQFDQFVPASDELGAETRSFAMPSVAGSRNATVLSNLSSVPTHSIQTAPEEPSIEAVVNDDVSDPSLIEGRLFKKTSTVAEASSKTTASVVEVANAGTEGAGIPLPVRRSESSLFVEVRVSVVRQAGTRPHDWHNLILPPDVESLDSPGPVAPSEERILAQ